MDSYRRGNLTFDVLDRGPTGAPAAHPVVLLHGFPQFNTLWEPVMDRLTEHGYRCLAPNQRGYSPGARPPRRRDYSFENLADDVAALIDEIGGGPVHLVGHDLGAAVSWFLAARAPEKVRSLAVLSVPHPASFKEALLSSRQALSSYYIYLFQFPRLPELWMTRRGGRGFARGLKGHTRENAMRDVRAMIDTGTLTPALNWYRAMPATFVGPELGPVAAPTLMVWSDGDVIVKEDGIRTTGRHVTGEYRLEIMRGVTHWIADECPDRLAELLADWFAAHDG